MNYFCKPRVDGEPYDWRLAKILAWIILALLIVLAVLSYPLIQTHGFGNVSHAIFGCPIEKITTYMGGTQMSYSGCVGQYLR
jgi:hypothetical protein